MIPVRSYVKSHAPWTAARMLWQLGLAAFLVAFIAPLYVHAVTSISQSYTTTDQLSAGTIVSINSGASNRVTAAVAGNTDSLLGVVISADTSLLSLSNGSTNQVQVATSGIIPVFVSDMNGPINKGDFITVSPIKGVGTKATHSMQTLGIAQGPVSNASVQSYTAQDGSKHSVTIGEVPVLINVSYYTVQTDSSIIPAAVQNAANAFAGKPVSTLPILVSAAIFIITIVVVASIIYSMVRSSIISVGRNPMAQSAVYRNVIQLSALVVVILAVGLTSIYLILTRL